MSKSYHVPQFDGKEESWALFKPRFFACAVLKKFDKALDVLNHGLPVNPDVLSSEVTMAAQETKNIEANDLAMASYTMAFTVPHLFEFIEDAKTLRYPNGLAHKVHKALEDFYNPQDRISGVEAELELSRIKFDPKEHPDLYFRKVGACKTKFSKNKTTFTDEKLIAFTIAKAPFKYGSVLTALIGAKGDALKLADLQTSMKEYYRLHENMMSKGKNDHGKDDGEEVVLGAFDKMKCYNCGLSGHRAKD